MRKISFRDCPHCGCSKIYASSSTTVGQKMAALFLLRLVRCHVCMRRHYQSIFRHVAQPPEKIPVQKQDTKVLAIKKKDKRSA